MAATPGGQSDALESLLQEIDAAETRLASFLSGPGKLDQQMSDGEEELSYLVEEINLLKRGRLEGAGDVEDEGGLHYYLVVGEIEKQVAELRNVAEINRNSISKNESILESLESMVHDQREVVASLEKELGPDVEKPTKAVDEKATELYDKNQMNKVILSDLKSSFRDLLRSQMRTESEAGTDSMSLVLGTLWRKFVAGGPREAVTKLEELGSEVDRDCLEQLTRAGIIQQEGDVLRLVDLSS